jgi:hypothetical protein
MADVEVLFGQQKPPSMESTYVDAFMGEAWWNSRGIFLSF